MNSCNVNKFINTRYRRLMTVTDIDMMMQKKSKNHIRIVESKYPTESDNKSQDDVLKEIALIFDYAIKKGYVNKMGIVPKLEVLKLICEPRLVTKVNHEHIPNTQQEVYEINSMKTTSYLDGSEKYYQTQNEIDDFFLMEENVLDKYNKYYSEYYKSYQLF